jgi:hypothetical protein
MTDLREFLLERFPLALDMFHLLQLEIMVLKLIMPVLHEVARSRSAVTGRWRATTTRS